MANVEPSDFKQEREYSLPKYRVSHAMGYLKGNGVVTIVCRSGGRTGNSAGEMLFRGKGYFVVSAQ